MEMAGAIPCHVKATRHEGALYVFAQNIDMKLRSGRATIHVEGLTPGTTVEVVDESRSIAAAGGRFSDNFAALQEHVYRVPQPRGDK